MVSRVSRELPKSATNNADVIREIFNCASHVDPVDVSKQIGDHIGDSLNNPKWDVRSRTLENILKVIDHQKIELSDAKFESLVKLLLDCFSKEKMGTVIVTYVKIIFQLAIAIPLKISSHAQNLLNLLIEKYKAPRTRDVFFYQTAQVLLLIGDGSCIESIISGMQSKLINSKIFATELMLFTLLNYSQMFCREDLRSITRALPSLMEHSKGELRSPAFKLAALLSEKFDLQINYPAAKQKMIDLERDNLPYGSSEIDFIDLYQYKYGIQQNEAEVPYQTARAAENLHTKSVSIVAPADPVPIKGRVAEPSFHEPTAAHSVIAADVSVVSQHVSAVSDFSALFVKNFFSTNLDIKVNQKNLSQSPLADPLITQLDIDMAIASFGDNIFPAKFAEALSVIESMPSTVSYNDMGKIQSLFHYLSMMVLIDPGRMFPKQEFDEEHWISTLSQSYLDGMKKAASFNKKLSRASFVSIFQLVVQKLVKGHNQLSRELRRSLAEIVDACDAYVLLIDCIEFVGNNQLLASITQMLIECTQMCEKDPKATLRIPVERILPVYYYSRAVKDLSILQCVFDAMIDDGIRWSAFNGIIPGDEDATYHRLIYNKLFDKCGTEEDKKIRYAY